MSEPRSTDRVEVLADTITGFDDVDKLVCEYAREVTINWNRVRDEVFERLREHFDDAQIVELTWRISLCGAFNRFNDVLQTQIEDGVEVLEQHIEAAQ